MRFLNFISSFFTKKFSKQKASAFGEESKTKDHPLQLTCNPNGLHLHINGHESFIHWTTIERIEAYKLDLLTTDCICTRIIYSNKQIQITEETPDWQEFVEGISMYLPSVKNKWHETISHPPFDCSLQTIYEREDRIMPESNNCYAELFCQTSNPIITIFQQEGRSANKCSFTDFEIVNNWSELILSESGDDLLLHGAIAYHQHNINILKRVFDSCHCGYNIELYKDGILTLQFKKNI
jgi:hypothetical protein